MKTKLILSGLLLCATWCMGQQIVVEENKAANKTTFFQGEPIALDIIITNPSQRDKAICPCSGWKLYSKTFGVEGKALKEMAPGPKPPEMIKSHATRPPAASSSSVAPARNCSCDLLTDGNIIVPKAGSVHYPLLINTCDTYHGCYLGGLWKSTLPLGEYEFTFYMFFANDPPVEKKITFSVVEPTHAQKLYLEKISAEYKRDAFDKTLQVAETSHEPGITDKVLTMVIGGGYLKTHSDAWVKNVARYSNEALLIQQLSQIATAYDNDAQVDRMSLYMRIIGKLQDREDRIVDAFISKIESHNISMANKKTYKKIPPGQIDKMKKEWDDKKKEKKKKKKD